MPCYSFETKLKGKACSLITSFRTIWETDRHIYSKQILQKKMVVMINNVIDFLATIFRLSNPEDVNQSVQKPLLCLCSHRRAGVFHLDQNCKSESAFLQEQEWKQAPLHGSSKNTHSPCKMDIIAHGWGKGVFGLAITAQLKNLPVSMLDSQPALKSEIWVRICVSVSSLTEKDPRVWEHKLDISQQCVDAATEAKQILGCICRGTTSRDRGAIIPLYSALVSPHMQYCVQFWFPCSPKDVDRLERVQRRAMKMIRWLENLS